MIERVSRDTAPPCNTPLLAPFPYFGGKRTITSQVWARLGSPTQYIEPFCGSAAMLLAAPRTASLEVINDASGFIANFWRAVKYQYHAVAQWADYPISHIDLGARHIWLMKQRERLNEEMQDPDWPGDAKVAGWWLWGQCCWIGSGWCDWAGKVPNDDTIGQIPFIGNAGMGVQAIGQIPFVSRPGQGVQAIGQIPFILNAGKGVQALGQIPQAGDQNEFMTSSGRTADVWLQKIAKRLERVRVFHGEWSRCLNNYYGGNDTAVFLDPPYRSYEQVYRNETTVADAVEQWAQQNTHLRIALCGLRDDYDLPGWDVVEWSRGKFTYSGSNTTAKECVWYSPACLPAVRRGFF